MRASRVVLARLGQSVSQSTSHGVMIHGVTIADMVLFKSGSPLRSPPFFHPSTRQPTHIVASTLSRPTAWQRPTCRRSLIPRRAVKHPSDVMRFLRSVHACLCILLATTSATSPPHQDQESPLVFRFSSMENARQAALEWTKSVPRQGVSARQPPAPLIIQYQSQLGPARL